LNNTQPFCPSPYPQAHTDVDLLSTPKHERSQPDKPKDVEKLGVVEENVTNLRRDGPLVQAKRNSVASKSESMSFKHQQATSDDLPAAPTSGMQQVNFTPSLVDGGTVYPAQQHLQQK